jgi:uncharacterized membrane protein (TIGR01666 family)
MSTANLTINFNSLLRKLISDSNIHSGLRVLIAMTIAFIPAFTHYSMPFFEQSNLQISISLCLGVMAGAIVETDDNNKNRRNFILSSVLCFFIAASCVQLLMPYPIFFGLGLLTSSFVFMMLVALGNHYSRIGFGAILIAIYSMLGYQESITWYQQPILLSLGGLWYGLFSITWNLYTPYRSLREQLAQLFFSLSRYQQQKSALFNEHHANKEGFYAIRQQLAIRNIAIVARFQQSKRIIQSRFHSCKKQPELNKLNYYFFIAEQVHERISASQYLYSQLEDIFGESQILEGYHQLLLQLSDDCHQLGIAINDNKSYQHSRRLKWTINALADQLYVLKKRLKLLDDSHEAMQALQAIYENLNGINLLLLNISQQQLATKDENVTIAIEEVSHSPLPVYKQLLAAMKVSNPIFKHAVRISVALTVAYILQQFLQPSHGFWILLTVLFVCQPSFSETRKRLILRSLGTLVGVLLGYPMMIIFDGTASQVALIILMAFLFFTYLRTNYGLAVVFTTLFVMFIFNVLNPTGLEIVIYRLVETLIGCLISVLAISFIFPDWQFQRFPALVNQVLSLSGRYFQQVSDQYQYGRSESLNYRLTRFQTFESDAKLTGAWQSMLFEPNSKQHLSREVYALANRCDALVSYIAALASHRHKMDDFESNLAIQKLITATSKQIHLACNPASADSEEAILTIEEFENFKQSFTGENLLIVEQLRLVAFTAIDIQVLFQQVKFQATLD